MKFDKYLQSQLTTSRRSPRGERGLKYRTVDNTYPIDASLPSRGAWIEIVALRVPNKFVVSRSPRGERGLKLANLLPSLLIFGSLPSRGAWIEIHHAPAEPYSARSLPSRGAWIEIPMMVNTVLSQLVAPLAGSVD